MNTSRILTLLLFVLLAGCRIDTVVVGEGTVTTTSATFNCSHTGGDCFEEYTAPTTENFFAIPAHGYEFIGWNGCDATPAINECVVIVSQNAIDNDYKLSITANFRKKREPVSAATYTYNGLGQRVTKTVGSVTTIYIYDESGLLIGEYDSAGDPIRQHVYVDQVPVAYITKKPDNTFRTSYVHTDHLGSTRLVTDQSQKVIAGFETTPFGDTYIQDDDGNPNRFPGQQFSSESGLGYNYFREYDPSIGRYIQSDPIGLAGGLNTYGYALQNPVSYTDPSGLNPLAGRAIGFGLGRLAPKALQRVGEALGGGVIACVLVGYCSEDAGDQANGEDCPTSGSPEKGKDKQHSPDRKALNDLVNEQTLGGRKPLSNDDADTLMDWANELGVEGARDDRGKDHWEGGEHIHIPGTGINHIPTE